MKLPLLGLLAIIALSGCSGPSKEELLRLQLLEAQRAEQAAAAARKAAEEREQRVSDRLQQALQVLSQDQELPATDIQALFQPGQAQDESLTRFVRLELQPAKYHYGDKQQRFSVVGMRRVSTDATYAPLQQHAGNSPLLEIALWAETETNRLGQIIPRPDGQRLAIVTPDFKETDRLRNMSRNWRWEKGLFDDLSWTITPEQAWELTSGRAVQIQLGFRLCALADCRIQTRQNQQPTSSVLADIISVLIVDGRNKQVLAEFIREEP